MESGDAVQANKTLVTTETAATIQTAANKTLFNAQSSAGTSITNNNVTEHETTNTAIMTAVNVVGAQVSYLLNLGRLI